MPAPVIASASVTQSHAVTTNISLVVTKPTGLAAGDLMVAAMWSHHADNISADTPPAGWTTVGSRTETDVSEQVRAAFYWKVADSTDAAASNFTFARTSGGNVYGGACSMVRITGAAAASVTNGSNFTTTADGLTTVGFPSITTTLNNDLILLFAGDYGGTGTPGGTSWPNAAPSGYSIVSGSTYLSGDLGGFSMNAGMASKTQASPGATGSTTVPYSATTDTFFIGIAVAIKAAPTVLTAATGAFTTTGVAATLRFIHKLVAVKGTFTLTGVAAGLKRVYTLTAVKGTFTLTGVAATLRMTRKLVAATGAFTTTGVAATLRFVHKIVAGAGAFLITGVAAALRYSNTTVTLTAAKGAFLLTGQTALLIRRRVISALTGAFTLTGAAASVQTATPYPWHPPGFFIPPFGYGACGLGWLPVWEDELTAETAWSAVDATAAGWTAVAETPTTWRS